VLQVSKHAVFAVVLVVAVVAVVVAAVGTRHVDWQLADCALHVIMQLVTIELCASRIFPSANALGAAAITAAATRIAKLRMMPPLARTNCPGHHSAGLGNIATPS
jgi:hypothetical protein